MWADGAYTFLSLCEIILHHHDCLPRQTRGPLRERDLACIIQPARGIVKWYSGYSITDCWIQLWGLSDNICTVCKGCRNTILQTGWGERLNGRRLFSQSSRGRKSKVKVSVALLSSESSLRGLQGATWLAGSYVLTVSSHCCPLAFFSVSWSSLFIRIPVVLD